MMKTIRIVTLLCVFGLLTITASGVQSQSSGALETSAPAATVAAAISYQGRLVNPSTGAPLSGTYDLEFTFWSLSGGGSQIGATIPRNAQIITNGLYSTQLAVDPANINGQELWLQIRVRLTGGTWETLNPRVQVLPTAYALSLRPGAHIEGSVAKPESIVAATNTSSGFGLRGESQDVGGFGVYGYNGYASGGYGGGVVGSVLASGYGVIGKSDSGHGVGVAGYTDDGYAVAGYDFGSTQGRGYGGYFYSNSGVGAYGYSYATSSANNVYAPGVYGRSENGVGVYGLGSTTGKAGGTFEGRIGVNAIGTGSAADSGYAGYFVSREYHGIYARGRTSYYDGYFAGNGGIYVAGGVYPLRADRTIAVNGSAETLEPGDIVAIAGIAAPLMEGGEPLLAVRKANGATDSAVVGVVVQAIQVQEVERSENPPGQESLDVQPVEGNILPDGYLAIVTHGLVPAVKVDALAAESLHIGDLLTPSAVPGQAKVCQTDEAEQAIFTTGTILGKVAGPLDPETGTVPIFVILQ